MKVVVLGATGFIGRNVLEYLATRSDMSLVAVHFSRPSFELPDAKAQIVWVRGDLRIPEFCDLVLENADVVIQAAAVTSGAKDAVERPWIHATDNAIMNSCILRSAHLGSVNHFLFLSCTVMYPDREEPWREDEWCKSMPINPKHLGGGLTKVYIEEMARFFAGLSNMRVTIVRHSNIFGPYDRFGEGNSHVCAATISKVISSQGEIVVWGEGKEKRDLLFVGDLCEFIESAIMCQKAKYRIYNCGSGRAVSIKELAELVIKCANKDVEIVYDPSKPTVPSALSLDTKLAREELGWHASTSLEKGLLLTIDWFLKNGHEFRV